MTARPLVPRASIVTFPSHVSANSDSAAVLVENDQPPKGGTLDPQTTNHEPRLTHDD